MATESSSITKRVRVVSWNLGFAYSFKASHERAWHYLAALDADIAFLQEVKPPAWAYERWAIEIAPHKHWGSAIVAKREFGLTSHPDQTPGILAQFGAYLATATLTPAAGVSILVASVHTSARVASQDRLAGLDPDAVRRPSVDAPWNNDLAYSAYRDLVQGRRFLVSGDWNTARLWDKVYGGSGGVEFFERAAADGWVECHRVFHDEEGRTWFRGTEQPYQLDHAFCDPVTAQALKSCEVDPYPVEQLGLSDHAPLVMEFEM